MNDEDMSKMKQMLADARDKVRKLEARIQQRQGITTTHLQGSSAESGYARTTTKLRWRIECSLCKRKNRRATRYPGGVPSVCDECNEQFETPAQSRYHAWKAEQQRRKAGGPEREEAELLDEFDE